METLAVIVAILLAVGALAAVGDIVRPLVDWMHPPQIHVKVTRKRGQRHRKAKARREQQAGAGSAAPAPCDRPMPDGLRAVRQLLEAQREAGKRNDT